MADRIRWQDIVPGDINALSSASSARRPAAWSAAACAQKFSSTSPSPSFILTRYPRILSCQETMFQHTAGLGRMRTHRELGLQEERDELSTGEMHVVRQSLVVATFRVFRPVLLPSLPDTTLRWWKVDACTSACDGCEKILDRRLQWCIKINLEGLLLFALGFWCGRINGIN